LAKTTTGREMVQPRPMAHAAYTDSPFGPFPDPAASGAVKRGVQQDVTHWQDGPSDLRGTKEFRSLVRRELEAFSWGKVAISVTSVGGSTVATIDAIPFVEIRVDAIYGGVPETIWEGAAGQRTEAGASNSPGPIVIEFKQGDMPDAVEIFGRARRGGAAETAGAAGETLSASIVWRMHT
jgi:hypothetical protein